jgi:hypothetical protein
VRSRYARPLEAVILGEIAAIVLRRAYPPECCAGVVRKLIADGHLYDPDRPVPQKFIDASIPEGYYKRGLSEAAEAGRVDTGATPKRRIDIGTSLGYRGNEPAEFFAHAAATNRLFEHLFEGFPNPVQTIYNRLADLAPGKRVMTAHEPDGRRYGPAILRAHYGGYTYKPHIDSVRFREERTGYSVYQFDYQFAGVLVLQNTELAGETAQGIIHRCRWSPEIDEHLHNDTFHAYAAQNAIPHVRVCLDPGDLYFFSTLDVHEVPGLEGRQPRIVLATFIGYSSDRDEIFVWS